MSTRLEAARHELRCRECRVTWWSWLQRLVGHPAGMTPRLSRRALDRLEEVRRD